MYFYVASIKKFWEGIEMEIGILSMQRVCNYGSFLQAYALKSLMEDMGHTVSFVDIQEVKRNENQPKESIFLKAWSKRKYIDKYIFKRYQFSKKNKRLIEMFLEMQKKYFDLIPGEDKIISQGCMAVLIGSDEIFNCEPNSKWGVTPQRFGEIPGVTTFSYAASCGYTSIADIDEKDHEIIESALKKMKAISVRDQNTLEFVQHFHIQNAFINLDPVFVYPFEKEIQEADILGYPNRPYMVIYAYHNRIEDVKEISAIQKYAKTHGLRTIAIGGSLPWCDEFAVIQPFQVLVYFQHAKCIVTDTFHGTVMAAKLNKPFAALVRESNRNKLGDLFRRVGIEAHRVDNVENLGKILDMPVNYQITNKIIETERKKAIQYLHAICELA